MHITKLFQKWKAKYADKVFNSLLDLFVNHPQIRIITIHQEEITYKNESFYMTLNCIFLKLLPTLQFNTDKKQKHFISHFKEIFKFNN